MNSRNHFNTAVKVLLVAAVVIVGCHAAQAGAAERRGKELFKNGDMEKEGGWKGVSGGKDNPPLIKRSLDDKHSGKASKRIVLRRKGEKWSEIKSPPFTTETGKSYEVRFWYKVPEGGFYMGARSGTDNNYLRIKPGQSFLPQIGTADKDLPWREYVGIYVEKKGGKNAQLHFICRSSNYPTAPKRTEFYLDDVSVREIDISVKAALKEWRRLFPGKKYVCWKKPPWDNVKPIQFPSAAPQECKGLSVAMGQNEYESSSFVVTNLSDSEMKIDVSLKNPALPIVLRQAMWVTDLDGAEVNDALVLLDGPVTIPSGGSQEIWLTVHTKDQNAGDYKIPIKVAFKKSSITIPLDVKVYPVTLPDDKPLYTCYWDETVPEWIGPELTDAYMKDMKEHYVNVAFEHPEPLKMQFDSKGKIKIDHKSLDKCLDAYDKLNPKMIIFWLHSPTYIEKQKGYLSDEWKGQFEIWLKALVKHLKERGWGYDRFAICPVDESLASNVLKLVKVIKEIDPKILIHINSTGEGVSSKQDILNIAPYTDIWAPFLYDYLNEPPYDRSFEEKIVAATILRKSVRDEYFWTYANTLGAGRAKSVSPYEEYRYPIWLTWKLGMRGFGYWVYSHGTKWQGHKQKGVGWAVVYLANAKDAPPGITKKELVIPSKRWEATREGVEDYVYLFMFRGAIEKAEKRGVDKKTLDEFKTILRETPEKVLENKKDHTFADAAKEKILKAIVSLSGK